MFPEPNPVSNQPAKYIVILREKTTTKKFPHYPAVYAFVLMQDALNFINNEAFPYEWALFENIELEEKQIATTKMVVKL